MAVLRHEPDKALLTVRVLAASSRFLFRPGALGHAMAVAGRAGAGTTVARSNAPTTLSPGRAFTLPDQASRTSNS